MAGRNAVFAIAEDCAGQLAGTATRVRGMVLGVAAGVEAVLGDGVRWLEELRLQEASSAVMARHISAKRFMA